MSNFRIFETVQFSKELEKIFGVQKIQIEKRLRDHVYHQLQIQPYFGRNIKKLRNYKPET